ncbi:hypothetical protein V1509DRAFT_670410 [Lipomyces kononenkoae]
MTTRTSTRKEGEKVSARVGTIQKFKRKEERQMEVEISEVLEILRRPQPSDSVLEFIVSEDGYKRIIEDREKSNRKYRVWYDVATHKVTINCCPSYIHERTIVMVIDSMVEEAVRVMRKAGVSDDVISRVQKAGQLTTSAHSGSSRKSYKEPDGLIVFEGGGADRRRIALEVGFAQTYSSLRRATLWWIEHKNATLAVLVCLTEVDKSARETRREFGTIQELNAEMQRIGNLFYRQRTEDRRRFTPLEYDGYKWFGTLSDVFFETFCETDTGVLSSDPVYLVKDGLDVTGSINLTATVGDFVPQSWLSDNHIRGSAVNFLQSQDFMEGLSNAIVETALDRIEDILKFRNNDTICVRSARFQDYIYFIVATLFTGH